MPRARVNRRAVKAAKKTKAAKVRVVDLHVGRGGATHVRTVNAPKPW